LYMKSVTYTHRCTCIRTQVIMVRCQCLPWEPNKKFTLESAGKKKRVEDQGTAGAGTRTWNTKRWASPGAN
jgi:hypothetical protein